MIKILAIAALLALFFVALPRGCQDIRDSRLLAQAGQTTQGVVLRHRTDSSIHTPISFCRSSLADIGYRVKEHDYVLTVEGCGAMPSRLPLGTAVDVHYAPDKPSVSDAVIKDTEGRRWVYLMMGFLLFVTPIWLLLLLA